jgi:glycosyltransferase involved in cell wall biosynthesis
MRILTLTTLYPNAAQPAHGVFVENRLRAFADRFGAEIKVIAPVPWFPVKAKWAGRYGDFAAAPLEENRRGFLVRHPRYAIPPKVGMTYAAKALENSFLKAAREVIAEGFDPDLIDAHYLYPDGVAAVRVARALGKPVVLTARGTDVNLIPKYPRQRAMILEAVRKASAVICVASALKDELVRLGAPAEKIRVLRNGVDLGMFRPLDRNALRHRLKLEGDVIASVGHLTERKGHHLVIEALAGIKGATLMIAGAGEERASLEALAQRLGVADRARFLGRIAHEKLAEIYNAADVLALASSREGWPNVLLEAMACGTPAVASPVWGSGEIIRESSAGALAKERTAAAMRDALVKVLGARPSRDATRAYAAGFSWDETSDALARLFKEVVDADRQAKAIRFRPVGPRADRPRLIVTVDTEERFDWSKFEEGQPNVCPPEDILRFQRVAEDAGVAPCYFLTYPLIVEKASAAFFRDLAKRGTASLGLHLHQWVTPPASGYEGSYYSFQCNLPLESHFAKLKALAAAFEGAFGFRAAAHRAGRYGIDCASYQALARVGIDLDFSPSPLFNYSASGGPDFSGDSNFPFAVEVPGAKPILTTPVCAGRAVRGSRWFLREAATRAGLGSARVSSFDIVTIPMRLTFEGSKFEELVALTKRLVADRTPVLTFSFHSTTMTPGANAYAPTAADINRHLETCKKYFDFFKKELGGEFLSLDSLRALYETAAD